MVRYAGATRAVPNAGFHRQGKYSIREISRPDSSKEDHQLNAPPANVTTPGPANLSGDEEVIDSRRGGGPPVRLANPTALQALSSADS